MHPFIGQKVSAQFLTRSDIAIGILLIEPDAIFSGHSGLFVHRNNDPRNCGPYVKIDTIELLTPLEKVIYEIKD